MTVVITHNFVSNKSDGADSMLVQPSNWGNAATNAAGSTHTITGLGTAAGLNTGTSGNTVPVLNAVGNTWANAQTFTAAPVFTDQTGTRSAIGLNPTSLLLDVSRSTNQTPTQNVWTKIQMATKTTDTETAFDAVTNYRYTPAVAGMYLFVGSTYPTAAINDYIGAALYLNGSSVFKNSAVLPAAVPAICLVVGIIPMNGSTDYVELFGYSSNATPLILGSGRLTSLQAMRIH